MSKFILGILFIALSFSACDNSNKKEIEEVESLIARVNETEKVLLSIDTSKVFGITRLLEKDLAEFKKIKDTLTKDEAFTVADYFGSKKKFYRLTAGYPRFIGQIETSKKQLSNLKQDLQNGLIKKDDYISFYQEEQAIFKDLNFQINKLITGIDLVVDKYENDRPELLKFMKELKLKATENE